MSDRHPDLKQLNRTFIGSVLFIDIVGYSTRSVQEQLEMKEAFNAFITDAVHNVAIGERIMVDTGDGAAIAFLGDPEDALFAALSMRDAIDAAHLQQGDPGFVRMGVNLGPLKIVRDINGHTNMIGDGVNDAQRVMSFAEPGQVMVSHSYYDIISRFSRDYAQLFVYEGMRHDKHVREHELYRFGPNEGMHDLAEKLRDRTRARSTGGGVNDASTQHVSWARDKLREVSAPIKRAAHMRAAMVASGVAAVTIVGAVWSWTSTPQHKDAATEHPPAAASATVPAAAAEKPDETATAPAALPHASEPPATSGTLRLAIRPWGEIYVDDKKRGVSPPMKTLKLASGKHQIEVRNGQFAPCRQAVDIKSGSVTTVRCTF